MTVTAAATGRLGVDEFYRGAIGDDIVAAVKAAVNLDTGRAGLLEKSDLEGYRFVLQPAPPAAAGAIAALPCR